MIHSIMQIKSVATLFPIQIMSGFLSYRIDQYVCFYTAFELTQDFGVVDQYVCFIQRSS